MPPKKGSMLLGFKTLCLYASLKESERLVAAAILDHFNWKTGQCDPSLDTIAFLTGRSRRTVIRSVNNIVGLGIFRRIRHGGHFHRNFYEPVWTFFEEFESIWRRWRQKNKMRVRSKYELSPLECQVDRHQSGDSDVTQTSSSNNISSGTFHSGEPNLNAGRTAQVGQPRKERPFRPRQASSESAASDSAERRWASALQKKYLKHPAEYAAVMDFLTPAIQQEATARELQRPGSGLPYILDLLRQHGIRR